MVSEKVFAVIAESTRRDILEALSQESKAVGQLVDELGVSQPTVSKHLRVLREAGVVTMRAQGQKRFYGINTEPLTLVTTWLESLGAGAGAGAGVAVTTPAAAESLSSAALAVTPVVAKPRPAKQVEADVVKTANAPATPASTSAVAKPAAEVSKAAAQTTAAGKTVTSHPSGKLPAATAPAAAAARATPAAPAAKAPAVVPPSSIQQGKVAVARHVPAADHEGGVPGQIGRSVGRAANKAVDLLASLPKLRRKKDS